VIKQADRKSIPEIAQARQTLVTRARSKTLVPDDVQGSSFTLTNLGMHRVDAVNAIINPPESAILGVGRIKKRPIVVEDSIIVRPTVVLTLSGDHRVFDGAMGARFLGRLVEFIENPRASGQKTDALFE
jgi:pyruvate dehydrogenase E2 component (dihydrolipoamide acetyltransferase)